MNTGGKFESVDLKVEINQATQDAAGWNRVEAEARQVFSDSGIVIDDLGDANGDGTGPEVPDLRTTFGTSSQDHLDSTNDWYTGLSATRDADGLNAQLEGGTQITPGAPSMTETDNVITPGEGDDLVVMSTNAGADFYVSSDSYSSWVQVSGDDAPRQVIADDGETGDVGNVDSFTRIDGNTLQNGASNETIVFEGMFGDDTIMNFTTADPEIENGTVTDNHVTIVGEDDDQDGAPDPDNSAPATAEVFTLRITPSDDNVGGNPPAPYDIVFTDNHTGAPSPVNVTINPGDDLAAVTAAFEAAFPTSGGDANGYAVTVDPTDPQLLIFTANTPGVRTDTISVSDFTNLTNLNGVIEFSSATNASDPNTVDGAAAVPDSDSSQNEVFTVEIKTAAQDGVYTIAGQDVVVQAGDTGLEIAQAFANGNDFEGWTASVKTFGEPARLQLTAADVNGVDNTDRDFSPAELEALISGDVNIERTVEDITTYNAGLDFLDYSDYLTSEEDISDENPENSNDSDVLIPVQLDYNESTSLGGSGDGAANTDVEANEVAVVRMVNDGGESETWGSLSASVIEGLFNNNVDDDDEWGGLAEATFTAEVYNKSGPNPDLIGDAKAILKVENPGNLGEYKVFELTWSGDLNSDSGSTVSAKLIGTQDYGTSLTGLDDINLVGSDDYGALIANGFANFVGQI